MPYTDKTRAPDYPNHSLPQYLRISSQPPGYNNSADKSYNEHRAKSHSGASSRNHIYVDGKLFPDASYERIAEAIGCVHSTISVAMAKGNGRALVNGHEIFNPQYKPKNKKQPENKQ